jgi:hypothetical protein
MKDRIEQQVAELEAKGPDHFQGDDWFQLSEEEEWVFDIDRDRWPRMVAAMTGYEVLVEIVDADPVGFTSTEVRAAREHLKYDGRESLEAFQRFAKECAGLSNRESAAVYSKHHFWHERCGLNLYPDEPRPVYPPSAQTDGREEAEAPETDAPCGCLYPGECCVSGEHQTSECCTEQTLEAGWRESEQEAFTEWWEAEGRRLNIDPDFALAVWLAARSQYPYCQ